MLNAKRMTFGSMTGRITQAELRAIESMPVETAEQRARRLNPPPRAPEPQRVQLHPRLVAYTAFKASRSRWPVELRRFEPTETGWEKHRELTKHDGNAHVVVMAHGFLRTLYAWYSWMTVTALEGREDLLATTEVPLPNVQITSGTNLRDRLFARDRHTKSPRDWVDTEADLVVIQLEPGAPKHDGITAGIIDAINRCEVLRVPVWLVSEAKWKYGPKHAAHHERIDQWLETAETFDFA